MLVVSDASPINVLVRIGCTHVLPTLFTRVIIPTAVARELSHANTPVTVRDWLAAAPEWIEIRSPMSTDLKLPLGAGEVEAISLAQELHADLVLLDDLNARRHATRLGVRIMGTLGVLEQARRAHLIDFEDAVTRLRSTDFAISQSLLEAALNRHRKRSNPS